MLGRSNGRPSRPELERAALDLLQRRGAEILPPAPACSASADDAEDAYQRALETLITKAPTTAEDELVPWLKTVVKHEAFSMRRQRERAAPVTTTASCATRPSPPAPRTSAASATSGCARAPRRSAGSSRRRCARCCSRPRA